MLTLLFSLIGNNSDGPDLDEFYAGSRRLPPFVNGLVLFGSYMSAAALLGNPGLISLSGYDGIVYTLAPAISWVVVLILVAEPYRSTSRFTIGDSLAYRLRPRPVHLVAGFTTLVISLLYLTAQLVGAGALAAPVLGFDSPFAQRGIVASLGLLMILFVVFGGMRVTTLLQGVKAVLLLAVGVTLGIAVLWRFGWNPLELINSSMRQSGFGESFLRPGIKYADRTSKLDLISLQLAFSLGAAGLPHVLMRITTVDSSRNARSSVQWTGLLNLFFCVLAILIGLGATALLGRDVIVADASSGNTTVFLLTGSLKSAALLTLVSCVAFATILAVVAGITLTAACALAHDIYGQVIMHGRASSQSELLIARLSVGLIGVAAITLSMYAQHLNISFLVGLAFAISASAILPTILYNLWWKRFTTQGAVWSMCGGLGTAVVLVVLSPSVSGDPAALLPNVDFAIFPLRNPGLISIPIGFLLGWVASVYDRRDPTGCDYRETEVRVLAGIGNTRS
ncbi:cation acetate symporter [Streptomyces sp. WAC 01325]|nr:cation acetate symporter [Streptomyces sp. WAC 01325]RSM87089.1 cation acetate symporter [Streptomyces sp. WAC 01325]